MPQKMNPPTFGYWLVVTIAPLMIGCSAVAGPHHVRAEQHKGLKIIYLKGYGCNVLHQGDISALHFGWYQRTLAFEDLTPKKEVTTESFSLLSRLPNEQSLHYSMVDAGLTAASEPTFCGLTLGYQFRHVSRLPMERNLVLEMTKNTGKTRTFSLKQLL
jgi:hypothetical protein